MPHLDVPGARLYWESAGHASAPAVLLIHAGVATLRMWDPLVDALAADHLVIRYDTRGFGQTEFDDVTYSDRADALAILDHLGVAAATVVGASRGGSIAIDLAVEHPSRVTGIVVIGSGPSGFPETELSERENELVDAIDAAEVGGDWAEAARLENALWNVGPLREPADVDPGFLRTATELGRSNIRHGAGATGGLPLEPPAYGRIGELALPTLVVVGSLDVSAALAEYEYLVGAIPDATGRVFRDAAHLPSVERPAEFQQMLPRLAR